MRVQAVGCTDVSRLGGKHLFDFLERRNISIISDKVWSFFGPFRWQSSVLFPIVNIYVSRRVFVCLCVLVETAKFEALNKGLVCI